MQTADIAESPEYELWTVGGPAPLDGRRRLAGMVGMVALRQSFLLRRVTEVLDAPSDGRTFNRGLQWRL